MGVRMVVRSLGVCAALAVLLAGGCTRESAPPTVTRAGLPGALTVAEWPAYGGDALGARYSPLAEITRDNVASNAVGRRVGAAAGVSPVRNVHATRSEATLSRVISASGE